MRLSEIIEKEILNIENETAFKCCTVTEEKFLRDTMKRITNNALEECLAIIAKHDSDGSGTLDSCYLKIDELKLEEGNHG